jgi:hypothetical protein
VRCAALGVDQDAWNAPGSECPVVRVGTADESGTRFYSFLFSDRQSGKSIMEVRAASSVAVEPTIVAESERLFVLTDGWVAEVDVSAKGIVWEYLTGTPIMGAWLLGDGRLLVVAEIDVVSLDAHGREVWRESISATVTDYRRSPPQIHITGDDGSRVVIDEMTGTLSPER